MAEMAEMTTTFKVQGPLFEPNAPTQLIKAVNRGLLDLVVIEGSVRVKEELWGPTSAEAYKRSTPSERHGAKTRTLKRAVLGSVPRDGIGQIDAGQEEFGANLHYSMKIENMYHMFQHAYDHINNPKLLNEYIGAAIAEAFQ